MWTLAWLALAWSQEAEVVCPPDAAQAVVVSAEALTTAWYSLDEGGFEAARGAMTQGVGCVQVALDVPQAVALHRARAIAAFVDGDMDAAKRSFAALRTLDPAWTPPADKVPPDHPLWKLWASSLDGEAPKSLEITVLPEHGWAVDGTRFNPADAVEGEPYGLPLDRAFVLQVFEDDERASYTGYHLSAVDVPVDKIVLSDKLRLLHARRTKQARIWGSVVGGALVAGAATTFGLGWAAREELTSGQTELVDVEAVAERANLFGDVSYGLAGAGALAVSVAWSVRW
jgi:hypothetical protein